MQYGMFKTIRAKPEQRLCPLRLRVPSLWRASSSSPGRLVGRRKRKQTSPPRWRPPRRRKLWPRARHLAPGSTDEASTGGVRAVSRPPKSFTNQNWKMPIFYDDRYDLRVPVLTYSTAVVSRAKPGVMRLGQLN